MQRARLLTTGPFVPRLIVGWVQAALGKGGTLREAAPFGGGNHLSHQQAEFPTAGEMSRPVLRGSWAVDPPMGHPNQNHMECLCQMHICGS